MTVLVVTLSSQNSPLLISDNGPEFISHHLQHWCERQSITLQYIQPGKPTQNAYIERNNGSLRQEVLDAYMFGSLNQARQLIYQWQKDYNHERPHSALGYKSPLQFVQQKNLA